MTKVWLVRQWDVCECETTCNCGHPDVLGVYKTKQSADDYAKTCYKAFVEEHELK